MKKGLIAAILIFLALVIVLSVLLVLRFSKLYGSMRSESSSKAKTISVEEYVAPLWQNFSCEYDEKTNTLIMTRETSLSYESACTYGGSVYTGELSPESYLTNAVSIAADVSANCAIDGLEVVLRFTATDGAAVFTVSSDGTVWTCWEKS